MKIGVRIPCYRRWTNSASVRLTAERAEALGFDSIWVHDHLVASASPTADVVPLGNWMSGQDQGRKLTAEEYYAGEGWWLDPFAMWGYLAGITRRVELASDIVVVPYRNPIVQAKLLGTLDVLSNGRMIYGVGAGHVESESRALGISAEDYAARGKVTDEYLEIIIALLSHDTAAYDGRHYKFEPIKSLIEPVRRPHPPIFIGGHGKPALRRAAKLGQAWLPSNLSVEDIRVGAAYMEEQCAAIGRADRPALALSLALKIREGPTTASGSRASYSPDEAVDVLNAYQEAGISHISLDFPNREQDMLLQQMELFAQRVRPQVR